jgi:type IV pilus assembly protein PilF
MTNPLHNLLRMRAPVPGSRPRTRIARCRRGRLLRAFLLRLSAARALPLSGLMLLALATGCADLLGENATSSSPASSTAPAATEASSRAKAFTDLAGAYLGRGQLKVALDEVRKAIQADNRYGPAYNVLGLVYMELAEDTLAEENFRKSIDLDRGDSEAHNNYGWFLCTRNRYDEGIAQFTEALRNPLYAHPEQSMTNAGLCSEKKGDTKQAEAYYNKALKLQPDAPLANIKLAALSYKLGKHSDAQRLLARYHDLGQATPESLWLGVRLERDHGDKDQAAAYALQLRKRFPDSEEAQRLARGQFE